MDTRCPVQYTCPMIDEGINHLGYAEKAFEEVRTANGKLRDWGTEMASEVEDLRYKVDGLEEKVSDLENSVDELQQQLDAAKAKIDELEDDLYYARL